MKIGVEQDGRDVTFSKRFYDPLDADDPVDALERRGERETDRRALAETAVSVAPLTIDREPVAPSELRSIVADFATDGEGSRS